MSDSRISDSDGRRLVRMARRTVTEYLKNEQMINDPEFNSRFDFDAGVFVTLNKQDSLRGCIGFALPVRLSEGLIDASIAAATRDTRFEPVNKDELDSILFEVTILTRPEKIAVHDATQYVRNVKVGRDGLMVSNGFASGLLLPQVATEQGWNEQEFLEHTCQKAGLPKDAWKSNSTKISKFQGIIFREESPNGSITRE